MKKDLDKPTLAVGRDAEVSDKFEHTPGPWTIDYETASNAIYVRHNPQNEHALGDEVCSVYAEEGTITPLMKANAYLIAAAPDMKSELEQVRRDIKILLAQIRYIGEATGQWPEGEDRVLFDHIETVYCLESPALIKATGTT